MSDTVTRWWWIRHAPVTTDKGCFYGQSDLPADISDRPAYDALAAALPADAVWVASHLQRTHQTAEAIFAAGYPAPALTHHEDLAEQHFGEWQGKPRAPVYEEYGGMHGFWQTMRSVTLPTVSLGIALMALIARVTRATIMDVMAEDYIRTLQTDHRYQRDVY